MEVEEENEKVQKRNLRKRIRLRADYRSVFATESGKRVFADLFRSCITDNIGFMQKETALHMQGRRWVFVRIHKIMNMDDEEMMRLIEENS